MLYFELLENCPVRLKNSEWKYAPEFMIAIKSLDEDSCKSNQAPDEQF